MILIKPEKSQVIHTSRIPERALYILRNGFFAYVGTSEPGCLPHLTAMFYMWDQDTNTVFLITTKRSQKISNIRRNTKVCVTVDMRSALSPAYNQGVMIRGRAMLVEMELVDEKVSLNYLSKYARFLGTGYPIGNRIGIKVIPKTLSFWKGPEFYKWTNPKF